MAQSSSAMLGWLLLSNLTAVAYLWSKVSAMLCLSLAGHTCEHSRQCIFFFLPTNKTGTFQLDKINISFFFVLKRKKKHCFNYVYTVKPHIHKNLNTHFKPLCHQGEYIQCRINPLYVIWWLTPKHTWANILWNHVRIKLTGFPLDCALLMFIL